MRSDPGYADFVRSGIGMEVICGLAGIALGVLALVGIERVTLLAVSAVVFGCALLMASMASSRINAFRVTARPSAQSMRPNGPATPSMPRAGRKC